MCRKSGFSAMIARRSLAAGVVFFLLMGMSACTIGGKSGNDPRSRLNEYISKSFNARSLADKDAMLSYLTGDAKARLSAWSEDQFRQAFIDSRRQFLKLVFRDTRAVSPAETDITYEISYLDPSRGKSAKVTNRKMSEMVLEGGNWMIKDVHNIKELIEYRNEMSLP